MDKILLELWTILSIALFGCAGLHYKAASDEEKLLDHLFRDYNPSARPVLNSSHTVSVNIQFSLLQIQDLNVRSQVLTTTGLLILDWEDERLTWHQLDKQTNFDQIVISASKLWRPEFAIINGAEAILQDFTEFKTVLYPGGIVRWKPGGIFKTMCQIDITYYPFDEQKCELIFGAWSYYTSKMNLTTTSTRINTESYERNGEWEILSTHAQRNEFAFECCPDQRFSNVKFTIFLRRRHTFYIMNVILPGILTSAVLLSIFFCTPAQKVHIGVAALLSFRLFLLNVADTIPRTSDHVPLLGVYLTCTMAITTLAMVATVFVLNLYGMKEKPVPRWARRLIIVYLARLLCMCNCTPSPNIESADALEDDSPAIRTYESSPRMSHNNNTRRKESHVTLLPPSTNRRASHAGTATVLRPSSSPVLQKRRFTAVEGDGVTFLPVNERGINRYDQQNSRESTKSSKPDFTKEWIHVAAVFDRLFFWLCLVFILVTTLLLFHPLTTSKYFKIPLVDRQNAEAEAEAT